MHRIERNILHHANKRKQLRKLNNTKIKTMKTSNKESHNFTTNRIEFQANNLSAENQNGCYVVKSYGYYPIFIYKNGQWYENESRYSMTTAKQMTQTSYGIRHLAKKVSNKEMHNLMNGKTEQKENNSLKLMSAFLKLGSLTNQNESEADILKYKEKIVFSTMKANIPNWQKPTDWDTLPVKEKLKRLNKIENEI